MATKSPSHPSHQRRRSAPGAARGKARSTRRSGAQTARSAAKPRGAAAKTHAARKRAAAKAPPPSDRAVADFRDELEQLGQRWKNLLPRLRRANGGR